MKFLILLSLFLGSHLLYAKELVIVSDLDETLRAANVERKFNAGLRLIGGVTPYEGLAAIFREIKEKNPNAKFYYLSNSFPFLYSGKIWTRRYGLPEGVILQRSLKDKSATFKPAKLKQIAQSHPEASFLLFGDNVEKDPTFYRNFMKENRIDGRVFIRDARLIFPLENDLIYFQTDYQITNELGMSPRTTDFVRSLSFSKLVPKFLITNLKRRLKAECKSTALTCEARANARVAEVIRLISP